MSYQTYYLLTYIFLGLCGVMFIAAVLLFIRFNIVAIIGDLSGRTAQKQIERFRQGNLSTGEKKFKPSPVNACRGKITDTITGRTGRGRKSGLFDTGLSARAAAVIPAVAPGPAAAADSKNIPTFVLQSKNVVTGEMTGPAAGVPDITAGLSQTSVLDQGMEVSGSGTEMLGTEVLDGGRTEVLESGTEVLAATGGLPLAGSTFVVRKSILVIHTSEVI